MKNYSFKRILRSRSARIRKRTGLTILEMAIAIMAGAILMVSVTTQVSLGMRMQKEADSLTLASSLAQSKLAQLLANPELGSMQTSGKLEGAGAYDGFEYMILVKEEEMDLAEVAASGELKGVSVDDQLPPGVQNQEKRESLGTSTASQTGGIVNVLRIIIKIRYPKGRGEKGEYRIETFRAAKKTV